MRKLKIVYTITTYIEIDPAKYPADFTDEDIKEQEMENFAVDVFSYTGDEVTTAEFIE